MMNKISTPQAGQMMKLAAENLRSLSAENNSLRLERDEALEKVAAFEREKHIERVARAMDAKGINPELSIEEKIASLRQHEKLEVIEEAVNLSAPQMKLASVDGDNRVVVEGASDAEQATSNFASSLASSDD